MLYEWDHCHNIGSLRDAVKTSWTYPRKVFELYTSAEVHTKQKAVIPKALFILPVAVIVAIVLAVKGVKGITGGFGLTGDKAATPSNVVTSNAGTASSAVAPADAASSPVSVTWRVVGRYAADGRTYVVLSNHEGAVRLVDTTGFKGDGMRTAGMVDGERVAAWSGAVAGALLAGDHK